MNAINGSFMPTRTSTSKKTARKPAAKKSVKRVTKKRAPTKTRVVRMTAPVVDEPSIPKPVEQPAPEPQAEPIHEVAPVVSESRVSLLVSRLSFYLGVVTGAAVLHVLIFALVSIVNS